MAGVCVGVVEAMGADEGRDGRKQGGGGGVTFSSAFVLLDNNSWNPSSPPRLTVITTQPTSSGVCSPKLYI